MTINGETKRLATAHRCFVRAGQDGDLFYDRRGDDCLSRFETKGPKFKAALLEHKMVVMTDDTLETGPNGQSAIRRKGYIAVFKIDNIAANDDGLMFQFVERVANAA